jgi:hypothetical protein
MNARKEKYMVKVFHRYFKQVGLIKGKEAQLCSKS